jgi:hypothetical protein
MAGVIAPKARAIETGRLNREGTTMSDLRIFSYLPNPRIWKESIAARLCGVSVFSKYL